MHDIDHANTSIETGPFWEAQGGFEDIKVVVLAGGFGTRITEESQLRPKPMVEVGGMPILWHILKGYSAAGCNNFVICAGYMQYVIKEWFAHYYLHNSDVTFMFRDGSEMEVHKSIAEPWRVTVADTGINTMTGGRIRRIRDYVAGGPFMVTYGDGVGDVDIRALWDYHRSHGKVATISVFNVGQCFGVIDVDKDGGVTDFREKSESDGSVISIGYMVFNPEVFDYLDDDETVLEREPLKRLAAAGELRAFRHSGFWRCMDTVRDRNELERLWSHGQAAWKTWS